MDLKILYYFTCDSMCVLEVKILGLPKDTQPGLVYHWLRYDTTSQRVQKFAFRSMGSEGIANIENSSKAS